MSYKNMIYLAGILGALAVGLGAFGAHGLKEILEANGRNETFETAVNYHFYHVLALLLVGIWAKQDGTNKYLSIVAWLFFIGIIIFSGSLYVLSLSGISWLGAITPIGGVAFIGGWLFLIKAASKSTI